MQDDSDSGAMAHTAPVPPPLRLPPVHPHSKVAASPQAEHSSASSRQRSLSGRVTRNSRSKKIFVKNLSSPAVVPVGWVGYESPPVSPVHSRSAPSSPARPTPRGSTDFLDMLTASLPNIVSKRLRSRSSSEERAASARRGRAYTVSRCRSLSELYHQGQCYPRGKIREEGGARVQCNCTTPFKDKGSLGMGERV